MEIKADDRNEIKIEQDDISVQVGKNVLVFYIQVPDPSGRVNLFKAFRTRKGGFQVIKT